MVARNDHNDPEGVRLMYRCLAGAYDSIDAWGMPLFFRTGYLALERALRSHLTPGARILDLGCGTGLNVERLRKANLSFSSYTGVDFSEDMLARANAKFATLENVRFKQMDLANDALPEGPFDLVLSTWVFEHLSDPVGVVEKAFERLVPGGSMVLLFAVKKGWVDFCTVPLLKLWKMQISYGAEENVYRRFPGLVSVDQFVGGAAVLAVLHKPALEETK